jgi:hypothetical protein
MSPPAAGKPRWDAQKVIKNGYPAHSSEKYPFVRSVIPAGLVGLCSLIARMLAILRGIIPHAKGVCG